MKQQILFVDDEPYVLDSLRRLLHARSAFWEMHFVGSADAALKVMQERNIDTVVTDARMPGRSGFELLQAILSQARTQDIPVIILTGEHDTDMKRRALDMGAADLLNKPICISDLIARLSSVLRLKSYQDQIKMQNTLLEIRVQERTRALMASRQEIIWRLAKAGEYRDEETGNHVLRVAQYCRVIGEALGLDSEFVEILALTSPLHDIGKIGIPDSILHKPGKLTPEEWHIMQGHCEIGARILREDYATLLPMNAISARTSLLPEGDPSASESALQTPVNGLVVGDCLEAMGVHRLVNPLLDMAATIALSHHEKWDGSGYPHKLVGEQIPLEARIVALADVYDALGSARPYKPAFDEEMVLTKMAAGAGEHFDPFAFSGFVRSLDSLRTIRREYPQTTNSRWQTFA